VYSTDRPLASAPALSVPGGSACARSSAALRARASDTLTPASSRCSTSASGAKQVLSLRCTSRAAAASPDMACAQHYAWACADDRRGEGSEGCTAPRGRKLRGRGGRSALAARSGS
jgi:hypothetical protein